MVSPILTLFLVIVLLGASIILLLEPMTGDITKEQGRLPFNGTTGASVSNTTGNATETGFDIFTNPQSQFDFFILTIGLTTVGAIAAGAVGFFTGGSALGALKIGLTIALITMLSLIILGVMLSIKVYFDQVPVVGPIGFALMMLGAFAVLVLAFVGFFTSSGDE